METIPVKMAKASKDDIQKTIAFFRFIEEFMEHGTHTPENDEIEEESIDLSDEDFIERLRTLWGGRFRPVGVDCMWSRVVFGCDILIDNVCNPDAETLEWKPEIARHLPDTEKIESAIECLRGNKDYFRESVSDKAELLSQVCDYVEREAKRKNTEPWCVMSEIVHHGSGVSSAIYELYRRQPALESAT